MFARYPANKSKFRSTKIIRRCEYICITNFVFGKFTINSIRLTPSHSDVFQAQQMALCSIHYHLSSSGVRGLFSSVVIMQPPKVAYRRPILYWWWCNNPEINIHFLKIKKVKGWFVYCQWKLLGFLKRLPNLRLMN